MCAKSFENPLVPHKRLREIYSAMVEVRILGKHLRRAFAPRTEACWIGAVMGLRGSEGDAISVGTSGPLMDYVLGAKLKIVLKNRTQDKPVPLERMYFALGGASRMKTDSKVTLMFATAGEFTVGEWKRALAETLRLELPVVFVLVPDRKSEAGVAELALKAGVPGIPVDATDAVGMYRVTQESIGRARAGGGPALIEGVWLPGAVDPVTLLRKQLLAKGVVSQSWIEKVAPRFQAKIPA